MQKKNERYDVYCERLGRVNCEGKGAKEDGSARNERGLGRREAVTGILAGAATVALGSVGCRGPEKSHATPPPPRAREPRPRAEGGPFSLPDLPYASDALDPFISQKTFSFHHGKHHLGYVNNTNRLIANTSYSGKDLETIIKESYKNKQQDMAIFNNAAQTYNHTFFWNSLVPGGGGEPTKELADAIKAQYGNFDKFKETLVRAAAGQFGSGWAWVVYDGMKIEIESTSNARTPIATGRVPLLTIDVWEHAYYLDYQNKRVDYVESVLNHLANWERANKLYLAAKG